MCATPDFFSQKIYLTLGSFLKRESGFLNYMQSVSVKFFRTPKKAKVQPDDMKSYSNAGLEMLSLSGDIHKSLH